VGGGSGDAAARGRQSPPGLAALDLPLESLSGLGVLVTGGSRGIGRACAEAALEAGARVVLSARDAARLERAGSELRSRHGDAVEWHVADVADGASVERLASAARSVLGQVDGVVHAAGVLGPIGPTLDVDPTRWWETVRVNLLGTLLVVRALAPAMPAGGRIVALSGGGATSPFPNYTAYASGKVGVVRLVETLAVELAGRVEINALAPGFVATDIHRATLEAGDAAGAEYLERTQRDLEEGGVPVGLAARAAVFLLSPASAGLTGRLVAAPWDEWWRWPERRDEIAGSDLFTLRRIVPSDRGGEWQ
jgi:NAD(P)-dependent dehydrogenase (short-subunit alcohol dehydrogenase family)